LLFDQTESLALPLARRLRKAGVKVLLQTTAPSAFRALNVLSPEALVVAVDNLEDEAIDLLEAMAAMKTPVPATVFITASSRGAFATRVRTATRLLGAARFLSRVELLNWFDDHPELAANQTTATLLTFDASEAPTEFAQAWILQDIEDDDPDETEFLDGWISVTSDG
jgi:DNA-binding LytR/AlgR family response regulator